MKRTIYPPSDHKKTCRLCGTRTGILLDSFKHGLVNKIYSLLHITISRSDCLSNLVCHRCAGKVNEFHNFTQSCLIYDSELRKKYNVADPSPEIISSFGVRLTSAPDPDIQIIEAYNRELGNKQGVRQSVATPNREMEQTDIQVAETRKRKNQPNANNETQVVLEGAVAVSDEPMRKDMKLVRNFGQAAERNIRFAQRAHEPTTNETMADKIIHSAKRQTGAARGHLPATVEKPLTTNLQNSTLEISQKETSLHLREIGPQTAVNSLIIPEGTTVTEFQKKLLKVTEGKRPLNSTGARLGIRSGPKMEVKNSVAPPRFAVRSSGSHTFSKSTKEKKESHMNILPSSSLNASSSATMLKQTATRVTSSSIAEPHGLGRNIIKTAIPGECDIFTCEFCEKTFLTDTAAKSHDCEGNESDGESTEDDEDELEKDNEIDDDDDDDGNEMDNDDSDEEGEVYLCNVCNAKYSTFEALIEHSTLHDNEDHE